MLYICKMDYVSKIKEDVEILLESEKKCNMALLRDRVRFIRLLKSGEVRTQSAAGKAIGLSERQAQRVWCLYQQEGLVGLLKKPAWGYWGKLSSVQISHLRQFLLDDQAQTLADIQAYLLRNLGVDYTIGGISDWLLPYMGLITRHSLYFLKSGFKRRQKVW